MGRIVIVAYRPKPGRDAELRALCAEHVPTLRALGFATSRPAVLATAADGTVVEVFEWRSVEAVAQAHADATVQTLWKRFGEACDYLPIGSVPEAGQLFSEFSPLA